MEEGEQERQGKKNRDGGRRITDAAPQQTADTPYFLQHSNDDLTVTGSGINKLPVYSLDPPQSGVSLQWREITVLTLSVHSRTTQWIQHSDSLLTLVQTSLQQQAAEPQL